MSKTISAERPDAPDALQLLKELDDHLLAMPYPVESRHAFSVDRLIKENVTFFVTRIHGNPAACGGLKLFDTEYGEVKRMYVRPAYRGQRLGIEMLDHLADHSRANKVFLLRLETGIFQKDAIGLYEKYGFQRRAPFGEYKEDPNSVYFEKLI